ncbi:MAG TPA: hypothetical protein VF053_13430 [Streptosporangiales bacterium]
MRRLPRSTAVAAAAVLLLPAPALAQGGRYVGTEYDQGGIVRSIDGPVPSVDRLANQVTAATDMMLAGLARERARLPYGQLDGASGGPARLATYPAPAGSPRSDQYSVGLTQGGRHDDSFVYQVAARKTDTNRERDTSWTSFSFSGAVTVTVRKLAGTATGCLVRPQSAGIRTTFAGNACTFTLTRPVNVSVEFAPETTNPVPHPMLVFANPPETNVPPPDAPNVLYLGPGVHELGTDVPLHDGETVYVAGGAWVRAAFKATGVHDVVIRGRGILDGTFLDTGSQATNTRQPGLIDIDCHAPGQTPQTPCSPTENSSNVVVDGLTLVNGPRFNVRVLGDHITVHNIKVISWWYKTDCIWAGNYSLVEDNFCKVNDDSLKPMTGPSVIRHNVVWQLEDGSPFQLSYNLEYDQANFHIYADDVIHDEHISNDRQAIFAALHGGAARMRRYLFENIHVEDADWRLFNVILENNKFYDPALGYGQISELVFRDIRTDGQFSQAGVIAGIDPGHRVDDTSLVDLDIAGRCAQSAADGNIAIDPATTDRIRIMASPRCRGAS